MKNNYSNLCCNPYSLLPTEIVIQLIGNLNNLRTILYNEIIQLEESKNVNLYTVWRVRDNYADYIIVEIPFAGLPPYNPITQNEFRFFIVNYADDGTLIQSLLMNNTTAVPISVVRTYITTTYRSIKYNITFNFYQQGDPILPKQAVCNLFAFPHFSFVLFGNIFIHFTLIDYFPTITYIGKINENSALIDSYFFYDYANGTIMGLIESQLIFFWNTKSFAITNYYPDLKGVEYNIYRDLPVPIDVIIGGQNVFSVEQRIRDPSTDNDWNIIRKATKGRLDSYVGNEPSGGKLEYTSLKEFIRIDNTISEILFIIAFTTIKEGLNEFPIYAIIGTTDFKDTQTKLRTFPIICEFVDKKNNTFQQYESIYFKFVNNTLIIYRPGFEDWRKLNTASIAINDVNTALLRANTSRDVFNSELNKDRKYQKSQETVTNTFENIFSKPQDF